MFKDNIVFPMSTMPEGDRAAFVSELLAANNRITEEVATDVYNVLDAIQVLLTVPKGQRIVINKEKEPPHEGGDN